MRNRIIARCAAGAVGVCFAYALIRQPFAVLNDPDALKDWAEPETTAIIETTLPESSLPPVTVPETTATVPSVSESPSDETTLPSAEAETDAPSETEPSAQTEPSASAAEDIAQTAAAFDAQYETAATGEAAEEADGSDRRESDEPENEAAQTTAGETAGGDVPTLNKFLSQLTCGGCRHRCLLVSPRCMKGRAKAESAAVEYYELYG